MASVSFCFLLIYTFSFVTYISCQTRQMFYRKVDFYALDLPTVPAGSLAPSFFPRSKMRCVSACFGQDRKNDCLAAQYLPRTLACYLLSSPEHNIQDIPGSVLYINTEWKMALRSSRGSGVELYHVWTSNVTTASLQDKSVATVDPAVQGVYKLSHIDRWWALVKQVKVAMYSEGEEKMYTIFDAEGSKKTSWFSQSRILESSYSDIKTYYTNHDEFFSVKGDPGSQPLNRRFFALTNYNGCPIDVGWFLVVDVGNQDTCSWAQIRPLPKFLYVPGTVANYLQQVIEADVFVVYIKM